MKVFSQSRYRLREMPVGMRVMSGFFLGMVVLGFLAGLVLGTLKMGIWPESIAVYYRGVGDGFLYPKSLLELLETAHFHLLGMPVVFLIVGHLGMMTSVSARRVGMLMGCGFLGIFLTIVSPFLVRYVSGVFAWVQLGGLGILAIGFLGLSGIVFVELLVSK